ncbi:MAG: ABC transporter ATP-binding protein [Lachnospiraceae bacterium]|nr:ABC transporter ATP-binding protein [Lachnospiraceae bacterium]
MNMIEVENISMKFRMANDKVISLKEFMVAFLEHRIQYKEFTALENINFNVKKGEVLGIIGRNGAGKSTLLKIIAGVLKPTTGKVTLKGNVVPMLELGSGFDQELSGSENIFLNGAILGYDKEFLESKYDEIVEFSELKDFIHMPIRNYSSGMLMRLAFSIATVVEPEILIVDEILAVGDEGFQNKSKARMMELMGGGTTVLFVSHSIEQIREMCDRVLWLDNHGIREVGQTEIVCNNYEEYWRANTNE